MAEEKETKQQQEPQKKKLTNPGDIKGAIDVHDARERRDGPGGN